MVSRVAVSTNSEIAVAGVWKSISGVAHLSEAEHLTHTGSVTQDYTVEINTEVAVKPNSDMTALVTFTNWKNHEVGHQRIAITSMKPYRDPNDGFAKILVGIEIDGNVTVYSFGFMIQAENE